MVRRRATSRDCSNIVKTLPVGKTDRRDSPELSTGKSAELTTPPEFNDSEGIEA